jgi:hypothetical protein
MLKDKKIPTPDKNHLLENEGDTTMSNNGFKQRSLENGDDH